jgi:uncharacterized protein (UPF0262 family)
MFLDAALLVEIKIDEVTWDAADEHRRREWRLLITELIEHHPPGEAEHLRLSIDSVGSDDVVLSVERLNGAVVERVVLPADALATHFRAYFDVCQQMLMLDEGSHSARLEALDMGKRVMHDRAARSILSLCGTIVPDHATARRLFSLLTSLRFDTTRMHIGSPAR